MIVVRDNPGKLRYEVTLDDELAGFARYTIKGGRYLLVHTEVFDAFEGRGVGSALAKGTLDDLRTRGKRILPLCPFIAAYIDRHPDYDDLVDHKAMALLDGR